MLNTRPYPQGAFVFAPLLAAFYICSPQMVCRQIFCTERLGYSRYTVCWAFKLNEQFQIIKVSGEVAQNIHICINHSKVTPFFLKGQGHY